MYIPTQVKVGIFKILYFSKYISEIFSFITKFLFDIFNNDATFNVIK